MNHKQLPIAQVPTAPSPKRRFQPLRDLPVPFWLLLVLISTFAHQWIPAPRWLMLHLLFLGAISHAILVWSQHFSLALLHAPSTKSSIRNQNLRLAGLNLATVAICFGVPLGIWPLTIAGASLFGLAVLWHAGSLYARLRKSLGNKFSLSVRYYIAAALFLPFGGTLGVLLARGFGDPTHGQVKMAHAFTNVFGWMGLTILGTLITLWPTVLRTRMHEDTLKSAKRAFWVLIVGVTLAATGATFGILPLATTGLVLYAGAVGIFLSFLIKTALKKPPTSYASYTIGAGMLWFLGALTYFIIILSKASLNNDWIAAEDGFGFIAPYLAAGIAAQILIGSLSFLIPVSIAKGPAATRAVTEVLDRGATYRVVAANLALVVCIAPVPSVVRVLASLLYVGAMAAFLPLMFIGLRTARKLQSSQVIPKVRGFGGGAVAAVITVMVLVVAGVMVDPSTLGTTALGNLVASGSDNQVTANGKTETIKVSAKDMRFTPNEATVEAGTKVIIEFSNADETTVHDLVFENGARSKRLNPGASQTLELGVIGQSLAGWCAVVGHKQMGMTFTLNVTKAEGSIDAQDDSNSANHSDHNMSGNTSGDANDTDSDAAADLDFMATPNESFTARDATLPELPEARYENGVRLPETYNYTFEVIEKEVEVSPGVTQMLWTFNGIAPGPVLHGRVGDIFNITLINNGTMGHSIDFHASNLAPDGPMRTIAPGESLEYKFTATRAGIWMYHCGTMPMTGHIANGMAGAVIIEPDNLPAVAKSYVLVQSEMYLGAQGQAVDVDKALFGQSDLVVFNGYANQYVHQPLSAKVGERVRFWVLDVGPNLPESFHIVGGQFDTVWSEGAYLLGSATGPAEPAQGGSQVLALSAAQGGFVELTFPQAGNYAMVNHIMAYAERGAKGIVKVSE